MITLLSKRTPPLLRAAAIVFAVALGLASVSLVSINAASSSPTVCQSAAIPDYMTPGPTWDGDASPPVSIVVANVDSGPGTTLEASYLASIEQAQAAGITVLGYVWTDYGAEPVAAVEAEVNAWEALYGVSSIFFDGAASSASDEGYYQTIANYVHATSGTLVMLNPGTVPAQGYMDIANIVNIFEGSPSAYQNYSPPAWVKDYSASQISNIIYGASSESSMASMLSLAQSDNAGLVYVTNGTLPDPYSSLPSYWSDETALINQECAPAATPTATPTATPSPSATPTPTPSPTPTVLPTESPPNRHHHRS